MNKIKRTLSLVLALVMVLGLAVPAMAVTTPTGTLDAGQLQADRPAQTTVNIYKLQADSYEADAPWDHTGGKITDLTQLGTNVKGLGGVTFSYYSVTEDQLEGMKAAPGNYDTVDKVNAYVSGTPEGTVTTADGNGLATVDLPEGFYWFVESGYDNTTGTDRPDAITSALAVPFGLSLPLTNIVKVDNYEPGSMYLNTVHVYPKNVTGDEPEIDKDVTEIGQKTDTYNVGDTVPWIIKTDIPANLSDYTKYEVTDQLDVKLSFIDNVKVFYGNFDTKEAMLADTEVDSRYITITKPVETKGGTLKVELTSDGLKNLYQAPANTGDPDNKLYIYFETKINEDAIMGQQIPNDAKITFDNGSGVDKDKEVPEEKKPKIETGGKKFVKVDAADTNTKLAGAVFTIKHQKNGTKPANEAAWDAITNNLVWTEDLLKANKAAIDAGKFATDTNGTVTSDSNQPNVGETIYLLSDASGQFEIKGLEYSTYTPQKWDEASNALVDLDVVNNYYALEEVKAPKGYAKIDTHTEFEINSTSYNANPTGLTANQADADDQEIKNKKLTIPQTGGMGTIAFAVAGLGLMGGALVAMKRNNDEDEEDI